jgi:hypothetical protein
VARAGQATQPQQLALSKLSQAQCDCVAGRTSLSVCPGMSPAHANSIQLPAYRLAAPRDGAVQMAPPRSAAGCTSDLWILVLGSGLAQELVGSRLAATNHPDVGRSNVIRHASLATAASSSVVRIGCDKPCGFPESPSQVTAHASVGSKTPVNIHALTTSDALTLLARVSRARPCAASMLKAPACRFAPGQRPYTA